MFVIGFKPHEFSNSITNCDKLNECDVAHRSSTSINNECNSLLHGIIYHVGSIREKNSEGNWQLYERTRHKQFPFIFLIIAKTSKICFENFHVHDCVGLAETIQNKLS